MEWVCRMHWGVWWSGETHLARGVSCLLLAYAATVGGARVARLYTTYSYIFILFQFICLSLIILKHVWYGHFNHNILCYSIVFSISFLCLLLLILFLYFFHFFYLSYFIPMLSFKCKYFMEQVYSLVFLKKQLFLFSNC